MAAHSVPQRRDDICDLFARAATIVQPAHKLTKSSRRKLLECRYLHLKLRKMIQQALITARGFGTTNELSCSA